MIAAVSADRHGNLYTGPNTEDTPAIVEATTFKDGVVIAQVNEIVDTLPRVDIPGDWVHFVVESGRPFYVEPLFTRDPAAITETQILTAMLAIKGIYAAYGVQRLNHGIGFNTAAIELLLPTYGERLGLKGKVASHWALNPHPTLIPAIESGWVKQIHSFGSEVGMEDYIRARPDVYFTGPDGSLRSNRAFCQVAGLYACDMFIGSTLQIDLLGNSSTVTVDRVAGFGGAPNMGSDARGRRHPSPAWLQAGKEADPHSPATLRRGRRLVVQIGETFGDKNTPLFVERLDSLRLAEKLNLDSGAGHGVRPTTSRTSSVRKASLTCCYVVTLTSANKPFAALRVTHRSAVSGTCRWYSACGNAASFAVPWISVSTRWTRTDACWQLGPSRIWCTGPAVCTHRRRSSGTGRRKPPGTPHLPSQSAFPGRGFRASCRDRRGSPPAILKCSSNELCPMMSAKWTSARSSRGLAKSGARLSPISYSCIRQGD